MVGGLQPGVETKKIVSYLPERTYLNDWMKVKDIINFFKDFYQDFNDAKDVYKRQIQYNLIGIIPALVPNARTALNRTNGKKRSVAAVRAVSKSRIYCFIVCRNTEAALRFGILSKMLESLANFMIAVLR